MMTPRKTVARFVKMFLFASLCLVLISPQAWSQITTTGTLNGTVTDSKGGVVADADIAITNQGTKVETHTHSNTDGSFVVPGLNPGRYTVSVSKDQFETYTQTDIILNANQAATVNAALNVGSRATTITVQASAVQVQTSTPEVSNEVNQEQVSTLPLNGRNYQSLSFLMPGVTNTTPDTALNQGGFLTQNVISVNGMGIQGTQYYLDGIWNENSGNFIQTAVTPNPDSIQEVRVLQNNYGAQYNLNGANALLVETRSGTQTYHGALFEYLRNDAFDARNYFSPTVSPLKQNIYGFNLGGPVFIPDHYNADKSKTFFFWSEQWVQQHVGQVLRGHSATSDERMGLFDTPINDPTTGMPYPQPSPGMYQIPADQISQASVSFLNVITPLPNNPSGGFLNYVNTTPTINDQRDDQIKVDHNITSKLRLMGEYFGEVQTNNNATQSLIGSPYSTTRQPTKTNNELAQLRLTQLISPTMVNTTSFSAAIYVVNLNATGVQFQSQIPDLNEVLPYPIPPRGDQPADRLPMVVFAGGYPILGLVYILPVHHASSAEYTWSDDWSWLRGKHYLQAGVQYVRGSVNQTAFAATAGEWVFTGHFTGNALADFLIGDGTELVQVNNEFRGHQRWPLASPYFQDTWKATRRLTLTLGIRYSYSPNPGFHGSEAHLYSNFVPSLYDPAEAPIVNNNGSITATPNYNPTNGLAFLCSSEVPCNYGHTYENYWNPTVGFAFDPFGDGKTSIRGGYGISHFQTISASCGYECLNNPPSIENTTLFLPPWPDSTGGSPVPPTVPTISGQSSRLRAPIVQTYSVSVQRQFGDWFASVTGAGNIVNHQAIQSDNNQPVPEGGFDFDPTINTGSVSRYASSIVGPAPYQGYGAVNIFRSLAFADWNALELSVKHPVGHDFFFSAAYTWQHGLSVNRGDRGFYTGTGGLQDIYHPGADYGTSNTNVGNVLTFSGIWNMPFFRDSEGWKKWMLAGWSYSDVTTIQGGFALDPGLSIGNPGLATRPDRVSGVGISGPKSVSEWFNTAAFAAPAAGFFGNARTGSITGPGVVNFDMALYKNFTFKERYTLQFRSEFFNIFNHTNFSGVSTNYGAGNFGAVTSALDPRIMEFALRFQF